MKKELAIFMFSEHRCCRNLMPLSFRLSMPFGPTALLNGSLLLFDVPTLQFMSCPKMNSVSIVRLFSSVSVALLNSSCSRGSTG